MGMMQSLWTGRSGLVAHQRGLDATSNNLANVNTAGYKSTTYMFTDLMKKSISGALPADGDKGSTNPKTLGLGVTTGANVHNFTQGDPEISNNPLHCMIRGNGFFLVGTSGGTALTRKGDFNLDPGLGSGQRGLLLDGLPVQGWNANANGVINPSGTTENIMLPQVGDVMPGQTTENVTLTGVLPTDTTTNNFAGLPTSEMELKGNLSADGQSLNTKIYAPVTQTDADGNRVSNGDIQEIPVRIDFSGPTLSADGTTNQWTWTMTTVDYPTPGDSVQIYPAAGDPNFTQGALNFHATAGNNGRFGVGQPVSTEINAGASTVNTTSPDGTVTSFRLDDFELDVEKLTNMADAPGGDALETWFVNGNPTGTMVRTYDTFDEFTAWSGGTGTPVTAGREVGVRRNAVILERGESDNTGTNWSWKSSIGDAEGTLRFDTRGDLISSNQTGGPIQYEFDGLVYAATEPSLTMAAQDGFPDGELETWRIDDNGVIHGNYSNQQNVALAQLAIGTVPNVHGMNGTSGTLFYPNSASGQLAIGVANDSSDGVPSLGLGSVLSNAVESSNVEIGREFTTLISINRGFQFNSRIVTTADEMLQTALQLKR
ncbi:MAG: flagellar hook-basal body complex protein [Planctomycetaceae bacterium]|nr:flagellar hook-basal body complex protein [Planctomycetaceae bacterium]